MTSPRSPAFHGRSLCLALAALFFVQWAWASNPLSEARNMAEAGQKASRTSQSKIDQLDEQTQRQLEETLENERQLQLTSAYNRQLKVLLKDQSKSISELERSISAIDDIERGMLPLLNDMLSDLRSFVRQDQPFLSLEREERLARLETILTKADVSVAEKYRQVLQAYQVELEYARNLETRTAVLNHPDAPHAGKQVQFVRLGRLGYYYQTLDGQHSAMWQPQSRSWELLDSVHNPTLTEAIQMARSEALPGLLYLPLPLPGTGSEPSNAGGTQ